MSLETIITEHKKYHSVSEIQQNSIARAYEFAQKAHQNQKRASGEEYFTHVYETALQLARWKLDTTTIIAGLLHEL
jgi:GTP pyrophosphokinase